MYYLYIIIHCNLDHACLADINECLIDNGECEQTCDNIDGSYQCSCWNGYEFTSDNYTCTGMANIAFTNSFYLIHLNISECLIGTYNCSQICVELDGGYESNCSSRYELRDDRFTCKGIFKVLWNIIIIVCINACRY